MFFEKRIERALERLRASGPIPLRVELWDGRRFDLAAAPTVLMRVRKPSALRYFVSPTLAGLGEAFVKAISQSKGGSKRCSTLHVVSDALLAVDEAGLSEFQFPWRALEASEGAHVRVSYPEPVESVSRLRAKVYGARLGAADMEAIIRDVAAGVDSDLQLAAFVTATAGDRSVEAETIALTQAMLGAGEQAA